MKRTAKITFCAVMAALAVAVMLLSYFPYLTYAIPAISGLFIMVIQIELGTKWAFSGYGISSVLVFLLAETECKLLFILLFGYYPIVKAGIEHIGRRLPEWLLKLAVFNAAAVLIYGLLSRVFGVSPEEAGELGKYGVYLLWAMGNAVFVLYDVAVSAMAGTYLQKIQPKLTRFLKH